MEARKSVALRYDSGLPAPFVVAKGKGHLAEKLLKLARECGVRAVDAPDLADALFYLEVGDFIPEPFYEVVAELLVFVWRSGERGLPGAGRGKDHGDQTNQSE